MGRIRRIMCKKLLELGEWALELKPHSGDVMNEEIKESGTKVLSDMSLTNARSVDAQG